LIFSNYLRFSSANSRNSASGALNNNPTPLPENQEISQSISVQPV
jgi:hypothetical protein